MTALIQQNKTVSVEYGFPPFKEIKVRNLKKIFLILLLVFTIGTLLFTPIETQGKKMMKGVYSSAGQDWICQCENQYIFDCVCILPN